MNFWNWLAWPLGIRGIDIGGVKGVSVSLSAGTALLVALIVVAVVGIGISIASYVGTTEPIAGRRRIHFAICRALIYVLLIIALSGLALDLSLEAIEKPQCVVLIDNTQSMSVSSPASAQLPERGPGKGVEGGRLRRIDRVKMFLNDRFLSALQERRSVQLRLFDGEELSGTDLPAVPASLDHTDIPAVVEGLLRDGGASDLSEIVLLTDGRDTVRPSYRVAAAALQQRGVRLYPVIVGETPSFRDVRLTDANTTPYCRAFDRMVVSYTVHNHGCAGEQTKVEVVNADDPEKVLASAELVLSDKPIGQRGHLVFPPPSRKGDVHLTVRIREVPGEIAGENNAMDLFSRIVDEPIKVLYIDNFPRFEFKHTKQSLDRDPNIALTLLNRMPGGSWLLQGPPLIEKPELGFPAEITELLKFDVLVLGSISRGYFSASDRFEERKLTNIARFVSGRGGGLIILGGHRSFGHGKYNGSPLEPLFPFEIDKPGEEEFLTQEVRAELVPLARYHPALQLASTPEENLRLWAELPELMGCNLVGKPRPGAEVLAVVSKEIDGDKPILLASQQYGFGRVFACTSYSTFRWRLGTPVERGDLLSRFWSQVVRYIAPDPRVVANAINLQVDKPHQVRGETALLLLRPLDSFYSPLRKEKIRLRIQMPDESITEVELREDPSMKGTYPAQIELTQQGAYEITATSRRGMTAHLTLVAGASSEEFDNPVPARDQLAQVARESGGALYSVEDARNLLRELETEPERVPQTLQAPLWDSPILLFMLLGLCLSEWFFRKRSGLA